MDSRWLMWRKFFHVFCEKWKNQKRSSEEVACCFEKYFDNFAPLLENVLSKITKKMIKTKTILLCFTKEIVFSKQPSRRLLLKINGLYVCTLPLSWVQKFQTTVLRPIKSIALALQNSSEDKTLWRKWKLTCRNLCFFLRYASESKTMIMKLVISEKITSKSTTFLKRFVVWGEREEHDQLVYNGQN